MPEITGQDEARRALAHEIEALCRRRASAEREDQSYAAHFLGKDLVRLVAENQAVILAALRAPSLDRGADEMRSKVEATLTEWSRPSAIRLAVGEMMTAQEGRTANAVAAMLAAKVRSALAQQAKGEGDGGGDAS